MVNMIIGSQMGKMVNMIIFMKKFKTKFLIISKLYSFFPD